ncbi:hypothetical protein Tco_0096531 [Tanacetum coccineum]
MQEEDDLTGDEKKQYEADIEAMTRILLGLPKWSKYIVNVRLSKNLHSDDYDLLFDHLQQYEANVNASRAKRVEKSHDPLAIVANTYASSSLSHPAMAETRGVTSWIPS